MKRVLLGVLSVFLVAQPVFANTIGDVYCYSGTLRIHVGPPGGFGYASEVRPHMAFGVKNTHLGSAFAVFAEKTGTLRSLQRGPYAPFVYDGRVDLRRREFQGGAYFLGTRLNAVDRVRVQFKSTGPANGWEHERFVGFIQVLKRNGQVIKARLECSDTPAELDF